MEQSDFQNTFQLTFSQYIVVKHLSLLKQFDLDGVIKPSLFGQIKLN